MKRSLLFASSLGFGLVEILVVVSVVSVMAFSAIAAIAVSLETTQRSLRMSQAQMLLTEGAEVLRIIADSDWSDIEAITLNTPYQVDLSGTLWQVSSGTEDIDGIFTRSFLLDDVRRDGNGEIASSGTIDDGTYLAAFTVTWTDRSGARQATLSTYIFDF
jgi:competence protein ComGC